MWHQEKLAQYNKLRNIKGVMNGESLSNLHYGKVRDKFSNYGRIMKRKEIEIHGKNEKMFNRLLNIL